MRIAEFYVEGFGRLANVSMTDVPPGLSIVLGENEAGKTTLLQFLRSILFGLPSRKQKEFYPPLNGGRKGGRIVLRNEQSERIIVERFEGKGTGPLIVTLPDGSQGGETEFRQLIGSATDDLYRNVFAFSLSELQSFESLKTEKVRDAIYSAGIGIGRRTIAQVIQEFTKQRDDLFVPGGSKPAMNHLLNRLEDHRRQINNHDKDQDEYQRIQRELAACEAGLDRIRSDLDQSRRRSDRVRLLQQAREDWLTLGECREQLQALPLIESFPVDGVQRFEELVTERRGFRDQLDQTTSQIESDQTSLAAIDVEQILLDAAKEIRRLDRGLELHEKSRQQWLSLTTERDLAEQRLCGMLRDLGDEWDEQKLTAFDLSVPVREEVEQCRRTCEEATDAVRERELEWELARQEEGDDSRIEDESRSKLNALSQPMAALDEAGIRKLPLGWERYAGACDDRPRVAQECETQTEHLNDTLRELGPHWTEAKLQNFDTSLAVQQQVQAHQKALANGRSELQESVRRVQECQQASTDAQNDLEKAEAVLAALPTCENQDAARLADGQRTYRTLRTQLNQVQQRQADLTHCDERRQDFDIQISRLQEECQRATIGLPTWALPLVLSVGLAALLGLGLGRGDWITGSIVCGLFTIATLSLGRVLRTFSARAERQHADRTRSINDLQQRRQQLDHAAQSLRLELADAEKELQDQAQAAGFASIPDGNALDDAADRVEQQLALLQQRQPVEQRRDDAQAALTKAQAALVRAKAAEKETTKLWNAAQEQWQQWLVRAELPEAILPETAIMILGRLDTARQTLKAIDRERDRIRLMDDAIQDYESQLKSVAVISGLQAELPQDSREAVQFLVARLATQEKNAQAVEEATRFLADAVKKTEHAQAKTAKAQRLHQAALDLEQTCQQQWGVLRQRLGLRDSLAIESAPQMLTAVERAREQFVQVHDLRKREKTSREISDTYCDGVRAVCKSVGRAEPNNADVPKSVGDLAKELDQAEQADRRAETLRGNLDQLEARAKLLERQIGQRQEEINSLLNAAATTDEESFRLIAADYETRQALDQQIRQLELRLRQLAGSANAVQALKDELAHATPDELSTERTTLEETIETREQQQTNAADERGRLREQLERLEKSDEVSRLRIEQQADRAEFATLAEEWSVLKNRHTPHRPSTREIRTRASAGRAERSRALFRTLHERQLLRDSSTGRRRPGARARTGRLDERDRPTQPRHGRTTLFVAAIRFRAVIRRPLRAAAFGLRRHPGQLRCWPSSRDGRSDSGAFQVAPNPAVHLPSFYCRTDEKRRKQHSRSCLEGQLLRLRRFRLPIAEPEWLAWPSRGVNNPSAVTNHSFVVPPFGGSEGTGRSRNDERSFQGNSSCDAGWFCADIGLLWSHWVCCPPRSRERPSRRMRCRTLRALCCE